MDFCIEQVATGDPDVFNIVRGDLFDQCVSVSQPIDTHNPENDILCCLSNRGVVGKEDNKTPYLWVRDVEEKGVLA